MTISLEAASAQTFVRMLKNEKTWLAKAAAYAEQKKFNPDNFLTMRLAPDMLPFTKQVQIGTDHAKGCVARLAGVDVPSFADDESTLAQLQDRIDRTVAFIETVPADKMAAGHDKEIRFMGGRGERVFASGVEYLLTYALPNFYFHTTMTYALIRHAGVDVGKVDFLAGGAR